MAEETEGWHFHFPFLNSLLSKTINMGKERTKERTNGRKGEEGKGTGRERERDGKGKEKGRRKGERRGKRKKKTLLHLFTKRVNSKSNKSTTICNYESGN